MLTTLPEVGRVVLLTQPNPTQPNLPTPKATPPNMTGRTLSVSQPRSRWHQLRVTAPEAQDFRLFETLAQLPGVSAWEDGRVLYLEAPDNALPAIYRHAPTLPLPYERQTVERPLIEPADRALYLHQRQGAEWLLANGGGLLADDMGLGKTTTAAVAAQTYRHYAYGGAGLIVIVGPGNTEAVWRRELSEMGFLDDPKAMASARGSRALESNLEGSLMSGWFFIPFHLVTHWASFVALNRAGRPVATIVDEAHWGRKATSMRGRAMNIAAQMAEFRVALTGTPIPNRQVELWNTLTALHGTSSWGSEFEFRVRYCGAAQGQHGYKDHGPTNTEEFRQRLDNHFLRRTIDSAGVVLPKFTRETLTVEMDDVHAAKYEKVLDGLNPEEVRMMLLGLQRGTFGRDTLRTLMKLRKVTSRAKEATTISLCDEFAEQGTSYVVFCWQKETVRRLAKKTNGYAITGDLPMSERDDIIAEFQAGGDEGSRGLFATYDTIKEGVTLTRAWRIVMHDLVWVPADILQAERRVYRIGQSRPVVSTWMVADQTFDSFLAPRLVKKGREIALLIDDEDALEAALTLGEDAGDAEFDPRAWLSAWGSRR